MSEISKADVLSVAKDLNFYPTEEQINEVIERFEEEADSDPTGCLPLWIENLLYDIEVVQIIPAKYHSSNPKPTDDDQPLVDQVIEQIKKDISNGDVTVLDELLKFIPIEYLKGSLSEA